MRVGLRLIRPDGFCLGLVILPFYTFNVRLGTDTLSLSSFLYVCRMARGEKETSTSQAGR